MKLICIAIIIFSRLTENLALIKTQYKRIYLEGSEWSEFMSKTMEFKTKGIHELQTKSIDRSRTESLSY